MPDREKVIKGLECHKMGFCFACPFNDGLDGTDGCLGALFDANIAFLQAQEPRVMTLEEVLAWAETPVEKRDPIFFEQKKGPSGWIANSSCPKDYYIYCENGDARCWTSRPTDAQMEATPWLDH